MNLVECQQIVKRFGDYTALNRVSINIPQGEIFGMLGPNGAGKTTMIRIINQITIPDAGSVLFQGRPIHPDDVYKIGYLPEERGLYRKMKVGEQAMYLARLKGMSSLDAQRELKKWFERFEIQGWWNKKVEELSKGMAQKVQFITTVLHRPKLLILDEPFSGFDPVNVELIRNEILRMKAEGTTIILSTHNMESVEELCDQIALINQSNLVVTGGVEQIRQQYGENQVEVLYKGSLPQTAPDLSGVTLISDEPFKENRRAVFQLSGISTKEAMVALLTQWDIEPNQVRDLIPSMKDIFIKLVKEGGR
ncbi:MAG: ATP-binding cassette domain-containing protein [Bacteroidales bacterium]|nr:ATP-binding cassette domain-containing protein [Bacteroidales bacterium]